MYHFLQRGSESVRVRTCGFFGVGLFVGVVCLVVFLLLLYVADQSF